MSKCARDGVNRRYIPSPGTSPCHFSVFSHPPLYLDLVFTLPDHRPVLAWIKLRRKLDFSAWRLGSWDAARARRLVLARWMKIRRLGAKYEFLAWLLGSSYALSTVRMVSEGCPASPGISHSHLIPQQIFALSVNFSFKESKRRKLTPDCYR